MAPLLTMADDAVLAPPTVQQAGEALDKRVLEPSEDAPNLFDELNAADDGGAVDVRAYKRKDGTTVTEYANNGQVFQIKVQPSGGLPAYYLYRNGAGQFERRLPGGSKAIAAPSWILKEF